MPEDDVSQQISKRIDDLESMLKAEIARIEKDVALSTKITSAEDKISLFDKLRETDFKSFAEQLKQHETAAKELESLRQETRREIFRIITLGSAIALGGSIIGVATANSYLERSVQKQADKVSSVLEPLISFQQNYARGSGLVAAQSHKEAIPYLSNCFAGHEYDETVLIPYLIAIDGSDDWEQGKLVIDRLLQEKQKYYSPKDATTWNLLGVVETDVGTSHPEYFAYAKEALLAAQRQVKEDEPETQWAINQNLWILSVVTGNLAEADSHISKLLTINTPLFDSWKKVRQYKVFRIYFERKPTEEPKVAAMWKKVERVRQARDKSPHESSS